MNGTTANISTIAPKKAEDTVVSSLKDLITASIQKEKELKTKIADRRDYIKGELNQIVPYREADKSVKEAIKTRTKEKNQYMLRPELRKAEALIKEMTHELKEVREVSSSYASEYYRLTQMSLFELPDGSEVQINNRATARIRMPRLTLGGRHGSKR